MGTGCATRALLCGAVMVCAGVIGSNSAQADPAVADTQSAAAPSTEGGGLEEIMRTAQRRAQNLQSVPISIQAFGKDELAQGYIKTIDDISALTPGLQFAVPNGFSSAFTTIAIRGLNTNTGPPTVGLYLDDTVISSRLSSTANQGNVYPIVWDLDRVEVERGPQGTLYGAGSEAGTVRLSPTSRALPISRASRRGECRKRRRAPELCLGPRGRRSNYPR